MAESFTSKILSMMERCEIARLRKWAKKQNIPWERVQRVIDMHREDVFPFLGGERILMVNRNAPWLGSKTRSMSAYYDGYITVPEQWIKDLVTAGDNVQDVEDAFRQMVGHEQAHKVLDYEYPLLDLPRRMKFCQYANEVHADVLGCQLAFGDDYDRAVRAMEWLNDRANRENRKDTWNHPSRQHRLEFVQSGVFNNDTIREIAALARCKSEMLIRKVSRFYENGTVSLTSSDVVHNQEPTEVSEINRESGRLQENAFNRPISQHITTSYQTIHRGGEHNGKDCKDQRSGGCVKDDQRVSQNYQQNKRCHRGGRGRQ